MVQISFKICGKTWGIYLNKMTTRYDKFPSIIVKLLKVSRFFLEFVNENFRIWADSAEFLRMTMTPPQCQVHSFGKISIPKCQ